jgi:hypothetical protein
MGQPWNKKKLAAEYAGLSHLNASGVIQRTPIGGKDQAILRDALTSLLHTLNKI